MSSKPIPLSVPAEKENEPMESVDDLLSSIRQLMSPEKLSDDAVIDLNRPVQPDTWRLSEKTLSESTCALSSFISALEEPIPGSPENGSGHSFQKTSETVGKNRDNGHAESMRVEDLVAQCLQAPLDRWIREHSDVVAATMRSQVNLHVIDLLQQWLDQHLSALIKESIDGHLQSLVNIVRKNGQF